MKVAVPTDRRQMQAVHWRRLSVKQGAGFILHHYILIKISAHCISLGVVIVTMITDCACKLAACTRTHTNVTGALNVHCRLLITLASSLDRSSV